MTGQVSVLRMLSGLVRALPADLDLAIKDVLAQLAGLYSADRAGLYRATLTESHTYSAKDHAPLILDPARLFACFDRAESDAVMLDASDLGAVHAGAEQFHVLAVRNDGRLVALLVLGVAKGSPPLDRESLEILAATAEAMEAILQRRENERSHLDMARRLEATLAAMPDLLFEVTADGHFAGFTAGPKRLRLVSDKDLTGVHFSSVMPPDVTPIIQAALNRTVTSGHCEGVRFRLDLPDGAHWFELTGAAKPAEEPEADPTVIFIVRDVSADMRMRDELTRLGKIVETMSNLVCITDLDENVVWCNAAFERQTGWTLDEIRGRYFGDVIRIPGADRANEQGVEQAVRNRRAYSGQTVNQDRWGNRYWIDFNVVPLEDASGTLVGFVSIETVVTRIKEQEAALSLLAQSASEARTRLENAVHALPDGVIVLDDQDRVVVANRAYVDMFPQLARHCQPGAALESLLRKAVELGVFGPGVASADGEAWIADRLGAYRTASQSDEVQLPDGRWLRRIHTRTSDGGLVAIAIDATARHNQIAALDAANTELRDAEARLRGIMEAAGIGTWELDLATETLRVGGNWAKMLGRQAGDFTVLRLQEFRELVHPDDADPLPDPHRDSPERGDGFSEMEFRMRHEAGHWVWILSRSRVTRRAADGSPLVMAGVHLDVSERKRLEEQLRAGRAYLFDVMDTSIAALAVLNEAGEITYANLEAERILGLSGSDLRGRRFNAAEWRLETVAGGNLDEAALPFRQALEHGGIVRNIRFALHWQDGTRRVLSANAVPLVTAEAERHVVVSFSDITEELAATARLEEARARAEEVSKAKSIFLANMSHEIRTPLNGVLGMAEVLDGIVSAPEQKQMVATIRRSGETLLTVLNSILDMSKIEAGKMELEEVPFLLSDLLSQVEALHRIKAEEKGLELQVMTSAGADIPRMGDPHRLIQILNNLLSNAIKFTEKGRVRLTLSCRSGRPVTIDVTDTGVGMTEAQLSRVFESFEQADGSTTRRFGGTGLGLSIVRQLVLLMGGMITMNSQEGQGTDVRIVIPLAEAARLERSTAEPDPAADLSILEGRKILIADDNFTNRLVLTEMLAGTGVALTLTENGVEAVREWEIAATSGAAFDVLLLDITMPVLDGMAALSSIRTRESELKMRPVPAIAVTANAMPNQVADYIVGGYDTHLAKPFKRGELFHALKTLLKV